jgi:hypothetical protein
MARVIDHQLNLWGRATGIEPQRSDLWVVDFREALGGLRRVLLQQPSVSSEISMPYVPPVLASYFVQSVSLPEMKVRADPVRRDSRAYQTPSWDEPLEVVTMSFALDSYRVGGANASPYKSDIYQMLEVWRAVVRAGRGSVSNEYALRLDGNYRFDYAFNVSLTLMRGGVPKVILPSEPGGIYLAAMAAIPGALTVINDLEKAMQFQLIRCWLGGFKMNDLNYDTAKVLLLTATFYADDIRQDPAKKSL